MVATIPPNVSLHLMTRDVAGKLHRKALQHLPTVISQICVCTSEPRVPPRKELGVAGINQLQFVLVMAIPTMLGARIPLQVSWEAQSCHLSDYGVLQIVH